MDRTLAVGFLLAVLATLLVGFPAELFNKTVEENRAEIRGWFPDWLSRRPRLPGRLDLVLFLVVGGILLTSIDRKVEAGGPGLIRTAIYTFVAVVVAIMFTTLLYEAPAEGILRRASHATARLGSVPFAVVVAILLGLLSYVGHFVPGYVYGLFITYLADVDRDADYQSAGAAVFSGAACLLGVSVVLWPVESLHPASNSLIQTVLGWIVIMGIQSSLFLLLPLRFLEGYKLFRWRRLTWTVLFIVASFFFFVLMVIQSNDPYLEGHRRDALVTSMTLFVAFALGSFAFWAYFRFRPNATVATVEELNAGRQDLRTVPAHAQSARAERSAMPTTPHRQPNLAGSDHTSGSPYRHQARHAKP